LFERPSDLVFSIGAKIVVIPNMHKHLSSMLEEYGKTLSDFGLQEPKSVAAQVQTWFKQCDVPQPQLVAELSAALLAVDLGGITNGGNNVSPLTREPRH
jgi:hypothetical protein